MKNFNGRPFFSLFFIARANQKIPNLALGRESRVTKICFLSLGVFFRQKFFLLRFQKNSKTYRLPLEVSPERQIEQLSRRIAANQAAAKPQVSANPQLPPARSQNSPAAVTKPPDPVTSNLW
jgi:hypothetical protein